MYRVPKTTPTPFLVSPMNLKFKRTNWNPIYDQNVAFFWLITVLGLWSIRRNSAGIIEFKFKSFTTIYTICIVAIQTVLTVFVTPILLIAVTSENQNFENRVLMAAMLSYTLVNICPILSLIEAPKMATYLNEWDSYQLYYETRFKKPVFPPKVNYLPPIIILSGAIAVYAVFLYATWDKYKRQFEEVIPQYLHVFYICAVLIFFCLLSLVCYVYLWFLITNNIRSAADNILSHLEAKINDIKNLQTYQQLRLLLRNLSQKLGYTYGLTYLFIIFLFYAMGLPITYVSVMLMTRGEFSHVAAPFQQYGGITLLAHLTHRAIYKLDDDFENRLTQLLLQRKALFCEKELVTFIESVAGTPVTIPLHGFFNLDRGINVPLYSSVITYLVIIVQFNEEKPSCDQ